MLRGDVMPAGLFLAEEGITIINHTGGDVELLIVDNEWGSIIAHTRAATFDAALKEARRQQELYYLGMLIELRDMVNGE
jgi:hypothetical protein